MSVLHFIHISDSHLQANESDEHSAHRLLSVVEHVNQLVASDVPVDFVVHTGDLVDDADLADATAENTLRGYRILAGLVVPWYLLNGNHDRVAYLQQASTSMPGQGTVVASDWPGVVHVRRTGIDLVFVNANPESVSTLMLADSVTRARTGVGTDDGTLEHDAVLTGILDSRLLQHVEDALQSSADKLAIFLHYPPQAQEASWALPPPGGMALHDLLKPHASRVAGVFAGHVHRSIHHLVDGILYVSVPPVARHFLLWPGQTEHAFGAETWSGLHYVSIDASGTRVQHHAVDAG